MNTVNSGISMLQLVVCHFVAGNTMIAHAGLVVRGSVR